MVLKSEKARERERACSQTICGLDTAKTKKCTTTHMENDSESECAICV